MTPAQFIHKNIADTLKREGYDANTALSAADVGLTYYNSPTSATKGKTFDACLLAAKQWAAKLK